MKGDYRALVGNINRRNLSNRGKCMVVKLESERQSRHLDYARRITEASITREEKEMRRKMEYLQDLMESNKVRKGTIREEDDAKHKQQFEKQNQLDFRHGRYPKRRTVDILFNKSIGETEAAHIKRKLDEKNKLLKVMLEESRANTPHSGMHPEFLPGVGLKTQMITLPEIQSRASKTEPRLQRKMSLSKLIASGEINNTLLGLNGLSGKYESTQPLVSIKEPGRHSRTSKRHTSQIVVNRNTVKLPPNLVPVKYQKELLKHNPFITSDFAPKVSRSRALLDSKKSDEMYSWLGFGSQDHFEENKLEEPSVAVSYRRVVRQLSDIEDKGETKAGSVDNNSVIKDKEKINVIKDDGDDPIEGNVSSNEAEHNEHVSKAGETEMINDESIIKPDDDGNTSQSKVATIELKNNESELKANSEIMKDVNEINTNIEDLPDIHKEHVQREEINVHKKRRPSFKKTDSKLSRESLRLGAPVVLLAPAGEVTTRQQKPLQKFAAAARVVLIVRQFQMN